MTNYKLILLFVFGLLIVPFSYAFTLEVNEGELVKLNVEAVDADQDVINYTFSAPLDENGEWLTTYNDAGNYTITVTADDGQEQVTQQVTLIVHNVNQAPELQIDDIEVNEGETAKLEPEVSDIDNDQITITYPAPFDENGEWLTTYDDAGEYEITITASDSQLTTEKNVSIKVNDVNQLPTVNIKPGDIIEMNETEAILLEIKAEDIDEDSLAYAWYKEGQVISENPELDFVTDYDSSGVYNFIATVYDKEGKVEVPVEVTVRNLNRVPDVNITDVIIINEGEIVDLDLLSEDPDGQAISYEISEPIGQDQVWNTTYDDAGEYEIDIIADDGETKVTKTIKLIVQDIDRAPEVTDIETEVNEDEELSMQLIVTDPDGDEVNYSIIEGPEGMILEDNELKWTPGYDFINISYGWLNRLLFKYNLAKLDHNKSKLVNAVIKAQGKNESSNININITVWNKNRLPVIEEIEDIEINETDVIKLDVDVDDPDNDPINIHYSGAMISDTYYSSYEDAGEYTVKVTAFDGTEEVSQNVSITINNKNREPELVTKEVLFIEDVKSKAKIEAEDPDGDEVEIEEVIIPNGSEFKKQHLIWKPDYEFVSHETRGVLEKFKARIFGYTKEIKGTVLLDDGEVEVERDFTIIVEDINRPPVLEEIQPIEAKENEPLSILINASDPDGDVLKFKFKGIVSENNQTLGFEDAGKHNITVTITDGEWDRSRVVPVMIFDTNRAPIIETEPVKVREGEMLSLVLKGTDPDSDIINYSMISGPEGAVLEDDVIKWTPDFDTAVRTASENSRIVSFTVMATDGELNTTAEINVEVINVNRPPVILGQSPVTEFTTYAGNVVNFTVIAMDPDNDTLTFTWVAGTFEKYEGSPTHMRTVVNPGVKQMIVEVTDGIDKAEIGWRYAVNIPVVQVQEEIVSTPVNVPTRLESSQSYVIEG